MGSINSEFQKSGLVFDRTTQLYQNLPYSKAQVLVPPNEYVTDQTLNKKLEYIYQNFLFLYKLSNYANFDIPTTQYFAYSGSNLALFNKRTKNRLLTKNTNISQSIRGAGSYFVPSLGGSVVFYHTKNQLFSVLVDVDIVDLLTVTNFIDPLSGSIVFRNITDIKVDKQNRLYVSDNDYKNLYYYTITTVLENEKIYRSLPFLKNVVGGPGSINDNSKFNNISNFCINENLVVVEDNINRCFKVFDKQLNWLNTIKLKRFFEEIGRFETLGISDNNLIFGIAKQTLYTFQLDNNFNVQEEKKIIIESYIGVDEKVLNITFSQVTPNIFYVITDKFIIKVWETDPSGCIGKFGLGEEIVWGNVFIGRAGSDFIVFKTKTKNNDGTFNFYGFYDTLKIETLLTNRDFNIFTFDEIKISPNEYTSNWVFQKAIKKLYYNHSNLIKEIKFKLFENNDSTSTIIDRLYNFTFLKYTIPTNEPFNLNVGINEIFQAEVINRSFEEIYTLQQNLMLYILSNLTTKKYLSPAPELAFESAVIYTYYSDNSVVLFPRAARLEPFEEFVPLNGIVLSLGGAPYKSGEGVTISPGIIT